MAARAIVTVPATARRGEVVEVRTLISHPMETGYRVDSNGRPIERDIIRRMNCRFNGEAVFEAELHPAIAANPLISFYLRVTDSGTLELRWEGDRGFVHTESASILVR
jgi:sulfur-oxidizing protein SoxZ